MRKGVLTAAAVGGSVFLLGQAAFADEVQVEIHAVDVRGVGPVIGSVKAYDSDSGLMLDVSLAGLLPGTHKIYLDEGSSCDPALNGGAGLEAVAQDRRGGLPLIEIMTDEDGSLPYSKTLNAPDFTVAGLRGRTLDIFGTADNYRDEPRPAAGVGKRVACGAVFQ